MKFIALKKHLSEDKIEPFYLITGDDGYIVKKAVESFRTLVKWSPEFNLHIFSENNKASDIVAACRSCPLGCDKAIVEVSNFTLDTKEIAEYLKRPCSDTVLVIVSPMLTKNLISIAKLATVVECDRLDEISLRRWVAKRVSDNDCEISESAVAKIVSYSDRFMSRIEAETEKLSAYKLGGKIEAKDVDNLVTPSFEYKIYELGDAIISGKGSAAIGTLKTMQESTPASYIIAGLYSYFRRILYAVICKDTAVAEYLGVKEFAVTAAKRQAATISPKKLKAICDKCGEIDFDFKSGKISDSLAVEIIIAQTVCEIRDQK